MKAVIIIIGVVLGIVLGILPNNNKPKPMWWKLLAVFLVIATISFALLPPIAGNFSDAYYVSSIGKQNPINIKIEIKNLKYSFNQKQNQWIITEQSGEKSSPNFINIQGHKLPGEFQYATTLVIKTKYEITKNAYQYLSTEYINPLITLPYIPDLEERARILNFHVPMSWIGTLAYLLSMIYSIQYLRKRDLKSDLYASSSAILGTLFTILATVTGAIWAKFNWGEFWNWDPRQTSIFVLLLIYFAYFALRSAIGNKELKARLSSVYAIIAFITVPFFVFVLPRIISGLHPGSADDTTSGPILSGGSDTLNFNKQMIFSLSMTSFTVLFFWLFNILKRYKLLKENYD